VSAAGGPPFDAKEPANHRWLVELNVAIDDAGAVFDDMMRPLRERELGPVKHRELHGDAWSKIMHLLGRLVPEGGEPPRQEGGGMH
jgi:hypothetical protein